MHELLAAVVDRAGLVGGNADAGEILELAVVEAEGPVVQGAHGAAVFDKRRRCYRKVTTASSFG